MQVDNQAQAIMLLTVAFGKSAHAEAKPLSGKEWGRFAGWLKERELQPSFLLEGNLGEILTDWKGVDPAITLDRLDQLLGRGGALALALEKWQRAGLWVLTRSDSDYPGRLKQRLKAQSPPVLFGCGNRRLLNQGGVDDSPVMPLKREEPVVERLSLPFHTTSLNVLRAAIDTLLRRAYVNPRLRGRCPGRADLECTVSDAPPWAHTVHFKANVPGWERAAFIVNHRVERNPPHAPVEAVKLVLSDFTAAMGVQLSLLPNPRADRERRLLEAERRLRFRMQGRHALHRVVTVAPWHPAPERRALQIPIDPAGKDAIKPLALPTPAAVREGPNRQPLAVRLERQWCPVARIDDRWSFDLWWLPEPLTRTYYRVNPGDGRQLTVFRNHRDNGWYRQSA